MKRNLIIGSIISAVFLYLALRDIDWGVLWSVLKETDGLFLLAAVAASFLSHWFRAYRWKFMLMPVKSIGTNTLFSATMIGLMANNLLPARLGELVRAHVLGRRESISRTASFATIVYERIVDVFCLLLLLWLMLTRVPGPEWLGRGAMWVLGANVLLMSVMIALERYRNTVMRIVARLPRRLGRRTREKIEQAAEGYIGGSSGMTSVRVLLPVALTSVPVWVFSALGMYFCLGALDMRAPLIASVALVVLIAMGSMIPSAPAYLGTTQYASIVALSLFGIGKSEALAFSILFHAVQFFPVTVLGLYLLYRSPIRLRDISKA